MKSKEVCSPFGFEVNLQQLNDRAGAWRSTWKMPRWKKLSEEWELAEFPAVACSLWSTVVARRALTLSYRHYSFTAAQSAMSQAAHVLWVLMGGAWPMYLLQYWQRKLLFEVSSVCCSLHFYQLCFLTKSASFLQGGLVCPCAWGKVLRTHEQ